MTPLEQAIVAALAAHPGELRTNTPVDVLAAYLVRSLDAFEMGLLERAAHDFYAKGKPYAP